MTGLNQMAQGRQAHGEQRFWDEEEGTERPEHRGSQSANTGKQLPKEETNVVSLRTSNIRPKSLELHLQAEGYQRCFWRREMTWSELTEERKQRKADEWEQSRTKKVGLQPQARMRKEGRAHYSDHPHKCWSSEVWVPLTFSSNITYIYPIYPTQLQYKPMP